MSCYSIPKRLMHILFGGSAIWLGTTFCSPLAASDLDLPPTPVVMPDSLETPSDNLQGSMVPAASLDEVSHWDNGPVLEDEFCNGDDACEDEFCWESDCGYDYAGRQEAYASEVAEEVESEGAKEVEEAWCFENDCCDKYAYDGYEPDASETEEADGVVDLPEDAVYSDLETASQQYGYDYDYDDWYAHDESMNVDEEIQAETEDYVYETEDDFGYEDEWMADYEQGTTEADDVEQVAADSSLYDSDMYEDYRYDEEYAYDYEDGYENSETGGMEEQAAEVASTPDADVQEADSSDDAADMYEDYWYDEEYAYDYEDGYDESEMGGMDEQSAEVASTPDAEVQEAVEEEDFSYEFDDYEMYYGYEEESTESVEQVTESEEIVDDATQSRDSDWEDYYYGDEYEYYADEYQSDSRSVANEMDADEVMEGEAVAEEMWADEYEYDSYEYDYYDYDYGMESTDAAETATDESLESWDESYDYQDPMDQYGYQYDAPDSSADRNESEPREDATDLFAWQPGELLRDADLRLIRSIEQLSDQPATERRTCFNSHIEALGFEAIDFAYRYEDATDSDVLVLADDLPGAAAFLACYRLVEQRRVGMDDGILLLQTALSGLSLDWIEEVGQIASPEEVVSASHPVVEALLTVANQSVASMSSLSDAVSQQLAELPWTELEGRVKEIRAAFRPLGTDRISTF